MQVEPEPVPIEQVADDVDIVDEDTTDAFAVF